MLLPGGAFGTLHRRRHTSALLSTQAGRCMMLSYACVQTPSSVPEVATIVEYIPNPHTARSVHTRVLAGIGLARHSQALLQCMSMLT